MHAEQRVHLVLGGCSSSTMAADEHASVYHCDSSQVTTEEIPSIGHTRLKTTGCGHEETFHCISAKCRSPRIPAVHEFAGANGCTDDQTTATSDGPDGWVTSGRGKTQRYKCEEAPNEVIRCEPMS